MATLQERFDSKWMPEPFSGCWLWTGAVNQWGYGRIYTEKRRSRNAHRVSWMLHKGEIPYDRDVCHHCDVTGCVNPDHLFLGTARDNLVDSIQKGRRKYPVGSGMIWKTVRESSVTKSKCVHGHILDQSNLYITPDGLNACRTCRRNNVRKWRMKS